MTITSFRIPEGDDLVGVLREADAKADAWVQAVGVVEGVELRLPDGEKLRLAGSFSLLSLAGPASGMMMAVLAGGEEAAVVGGELVRATSGGVVARLTHVAKPDASLPPPMPKRREASSSDGGGGGWAAVATQTAAQTEDETDADVEASTELPRYKDRVDHFKFGLCDVMIVRGNRMKIRDVKGPGRIREISLDVLKVLPPEEVAGKRVFKLVKRP